MPAPSLDRLLALATAFRDDDPDPETRAELSALIAARDVDELAERFSGPLEFGTAGLRGVLGAGESRMNRRVVAATTAGLCDYLVRAVPGAKARGLCIGFDGRRKSREFADEAAAVATAKGFTVHLGEEEAPTPLLAFSVLSLHAAAGIMITASHNPPQYNGYKVYFEDGAQIIPPHDAEIAAAIARVSSVSSLPRLSAHEARARGLLRGMQDIEPRYLEGAKRLLSAPAPSTLRIAYTALHGVGEKLARKALAQAGFSEVHSVAAQAEPDPRFPTVAFPNPEEKGAMDLVLALARQTRAELVLANDPDADRLAVAARSDDGELRLLHGNELGVLLADHLLGRLVRDERNLVLSSLVSTPYVARIAAAHGASHEQTLTGFKWIANRAIELERERGMRFVFGFEEAIGYTVGTLVRDKDGVATAAVVAEMAAEHARSGRSLHDALAALYREHGLFGSRQVSLVLPGRAGMSQMQALMNGLRAEPPKRVGPHAVEAQLDLKSGLWTRGTATERSTLPRSDVLVFELAGGHRIAVRPSGTEPKVKIYVDVCTDVGAAESIPSARARADALGAELAEAFLTSARTHSTS